MTSKNCTKCKILKPLSEFGKRKNRKSGVTSSCNQCNANISLIRSRSKDGHIATIYGNQKKSSQKRNHITQNYSLVELREWATQQKIYHKLYNDWVLSDYSKMLAPSFDRTDDYLPYDLSRLRIVTWQENYDKAHKDRVNGILNKRNKAVIQMTKSGLFIKKHHSMYSAERKTKVLSRSIWACCNGRYKTAGKFRWMYAID